MSCQRQVDPSLVYEREVIVIDPSGVVIVVNHYDTSV